MSPLDLIHARIERGYRMARNPETRPILQSALQLVEAAAATGTGLTLNPVQAAALQDWLDYHAAAQELGLREARATSPTEGRATEGRPTPKVIPFPKPQPTRPHA